MQKIKKCNKRFGGMASTPFSIFFIWFAVTDSISEKLEFGGIGGLADTDNKNKIFLVLPHRHKSWTLQHADRNSD